MAKGSGLVAGGWHADLRDSYKRAVTRGILNATLVIVRSPRRCGR